MDMVVQEIPIGSIRPWPRNPRQHFDPEALKELAASVKARGIDNPLLLRPVNGHYEIVAGERRWRAAQAAGLDIVPAIVREMDEDEAFEAAVVENVQRASLTPLEEAESFRKLLDTAGEGGRVQAAQDIAARIGKSPTYVWDMAKLADLVPDAQRLLERGLITVKHAVLIARLAETDQERVIAPPDPSAFTNRSALFEREGAGLNFNEDDESEGDRWSGLKAKSVRELERWIADHVRFNPQQFAAAAPLDFGPVAEQVAAAAAQPGRRKKVVHITHDHFVQPDAKNDERVYTCVSWRRADGSDKKSPECDKSVLGLVVVGPDYGKTFMVCIDKNCDVHWGKEKKEREKRAKERQAEAAKPRSDEREADNRRALERQQRAEEERRQWDADKPEFGRVIAEMVAAKKVSALGPYLLSRIDGTMLSDAVEHLGKAKTAEDFIKHAVLIALLDDLEAAWEPQGFDGAKELGITLTAIRKAAQKPAGTAKATKKGKKR